MIGYLVDDEFALRRDPIETPRETHAGALDAWMTERDFESRWIASAS